MNMNMWQSDPDQSFPWWQKSIAHFLKISTALIKTMEKRILHQCHWNSASKMLNRNHDEGNGHQCQIYILSQALCYHIPNFDFDSLSTNAKIGWLSDLPNIFRPEQRQRGENIQVVWQKREKHSGNNNKAYAS